MENEARKVYLFGAHITTQFFIGYGLNINKIEAILDNDIYKIGKRVGGIDKKILSPKCLRDVDSAIVIIPNSPYIEEIQRDIICNINKNIEFWN